MPFAPGLPSGKKTRFRKETGFEDAVARTAAPLLSRAPSLAFELRWRRRFRRHGRTDGRCRLQSSGGTGQRRQMHTAEGGIFRREADQRLAIPIDTVESRDHVDA